MKIKNYLFLLFCFLITSNIWSQKSINITEDFSETTIEKQLYYHFEGTNLTSYDSIPLKEYVTYNKNIHFSKQVPQRILFKFRLKNNTDKTQKLVFKAKAYAFYGWFELFAEKEDLSVERLHKTSNKNNLTRRIDAYFEIEPNTTTTYYIKARYSKNIYPIFNLVSASRNLELNFQDISLKGIYYGFTFLVLIINVFFFVFTKKRFFIYYVCFQLGIVGSMAFLDNTIFSWFGQSTITRYSNAFISLFMTLFSVLFFSDAMNLKKHFPKFKTYSLLVLLASGVFLLLYFLTFHNLLWGIGKALYLLTILFSFGVAIYYATEQVYARFIVVGYSVLIICHLLFLLPVLYGFMDFGFNEWHYKIGSVIEMLVFLAAIPYRHHTLVKEKEIVEQNAMQQKVAFEQEKEELIEKSTNNKANQFQNFCTAFHLTQRESELMEVLIQGDSNKLIAEKLFIHVETVKYHCAKIYEKTKTKNKIQLIALYNSGEYPSTSSG